MNFIGWKVQYSEKRLTAVRTLGGHLVTFLGIYTFAEIQKEAVLVCAPEFQGGLLKHLKDAQVFTSFLTVILCWFCFALYRWASVGARDERFFRPPAFPWSDSKKKGANPPPPQDRSCTTLMSGAPPAPPAHDTVNWYAEIDEGEDEAASIVLGFLVNQTFIFLFTDKFEAFPSDMNWVRNLKTWQFESYHEEIPWRSTQ